GAASPPPKYKAGPPCGGARASSTIRNNRLVVVIVMTATALTIPECGVSRNGGAYSGCVRDEQNSMSAMGVCQFSGGFAEGRSAKNNGGRNQSQNDVAHFFLL